MKCDELVIINYEYDCCGKFVESNQQSGKPLTQHVCGLGQEFTGAHTTPSSLSVTPETPAEDYDDGGEEEYEEYPDPNTNNFQSTNKQHRYDWNLSWFRECAL